MSQLFSQGNIGSMTLANRFVHSATFECMAEKDGSVTDSLVKRYTTLARGEIGLIIPGYMYVHPQGRAQKYQTGIYDDSQISGLAKIVDAIHEVGGKVAFQLAHSGRQTDRRLIGRAPMAPSSFGRDPVSLDKPKMMSEEEIREVIEAFAKAAKRAVEAGADGIQLHAAHGYLISQFLSPFYNRRKDAWGGTTQGRFRFLEEVFNAVRHQVGPDFPIMVKMNTRDFTPRTGVVPELAKEYAKALVALGIDGIELSCGTFYTFHTVRGDIPAREIAQGMPFWMRPVARFKLGLQTRPCAFEKVYNEKPARDIRPVMEGVPLILVGGVRGLAEAKALVDDGVADFISMSRPFIREPNLVKKYRKGKAESASCVSCNKCFAAIFNRLPLKCYEKGLPANRKRS